jgi:hypothetical protein
MKSVKNELTFRKIEIPLTGVAHLLFGMCIFEGQLNVKRKLSITRLITNELDRTENNLHSYNVKGFFKLRYNILYMLLTLFTKTLLKILTRFFGLVLFANKRDNIASVHLNTILNLIIKTETLLLKIR